MTFAGATVTKEQVHGTVGLFRYYHKFLESDCTHCLNPEDRYARYDGSKMTKEQVRTRLSFLVHNAINRKAGIPDPDRYEDAALRRDVRAINDYFGKRIICRVEQLSTPWLRRLYKDRLHTDD